MLAHNITFDDFPPTLFLPPRRFSLTRRLHDFLPLRRGEPPDEVQALALITAVVVVVVIALSLSSSPPSVVVGWCPWLSCRVVLCRFLCRRRQEISESVRGTPADLNLAWGLGVERGVDA